ncbi:MAG: primosomal protein N', partial [Oscillospiraceae bacterium]
MEKAVAKVAVSAATYQIDKPYDYIVPEELITSLRPGMRVLVPFSKGNKKTEGIVLSLVRFSDYEKLKCVSSVLDENPVISDELIKLALWMRERFFCTVYDAVKTMLPAGLWYSLSAVCRIADSVGKDEAYEKAGRADRQRRVLDLMFAHGGKCEYRDIELAFGDEDPMSAVKVLASKGVIETDSLESRRVKDKTVSFAYLAVPSETASETAAAKKRSAPSQSAVLELLVSFGGATVNDIRYLTGAGNTTVKKLEQDGLITIEQMEVFRRPEYRQGDKQAPPELTEQQESAFFGILSQINEGKAACA